MEILDHARAAINHNLNLRALDPTLGGVYAYAYNRLLAFSIFPDNSYFVGNKEFPWTASISKWYAAR